MDGKNPSIFKVIYLINNGTLTKINTLTEGSEFPYWPHTKNWLRTNVGTCTIKGNFDLEPRWQAHSALGFRYINICPALQLHAQKAMPTHPVTDNQTQARTHMTYTQDEDKWEHIMCLLISAALFGPYCEHRSTQIRAHIQDTTHIYRYSCTCAALRRRHTHHIGK